MLWWPLVPLIWYHHDNHDHDHVHMPIPKWRHGEMAACACTVKLNPIDCKECNASIFVYKTIDISSFIWVYKIYFFSCGIHELIRPYQGHKHTTAHIFNILNLYAIVKVSWWNYTQANKTPRSYQSGCCCHGTMYTHLYIIPHQSKRSQINHLSCFSSSLFFAFILQLWIGARILSQDTFTRLAKSQKSRFLCAC